MELIRPITGVSTKALFGQFDYDLDFSGPAKQRLVVLYGDNGSGKTTLLRLIRHALGPESNKSHRTSLLRMPFAKAAIELGRLSVSLERLKGVSGPLDIAITEGKSILIKARVHFDDNREKAIFADDSEQEFLNVLRHRVPSVYFLPESRFQVRPEQQELDVVTLVFDPARKKRMDVLEAAVRDLEEYLRRKVIEAANRGEQQGTRVYEELVRQVLGSSPSKASNQQLVSKRFDQVIDRADAFAKFGLSPEFSLFTLRKLYDESPVSKRARVGEILLAYLDTLSARFDALQQIENSIRQFTRNINDYFSGKVVTLSVEHGLSIQTSRGQPLAPAELSSGERHLLLLFCKVMVARDSAAVYLIDEPELSLNVKWQRMLLGSLLALTEGKTTQFIIATHSIEMITQYKPHWVKLRER